MDDRRYRRTMVLFAAMVVYIVLQLGWWGVLLVRQEREAALMALRLKEAGLDDPGPVELGHAMRMVLGEGGVLLLLFLVVAYLTHRALRRDLAHTRAQRSFLMAVTHELRSPIAGIKLQLETLARHRLAEDQRAGLHARALSEADRLATLADRVLLAAQAEEGLIAVDPKDCDVMQVLREAVERAANGVAAGHKVELQGPGELVVRSDPQILRSIADNLIENAAKYAPAGTTIRVEAIRGDGGWRLSVSDEGPGVPAAERAKVVERFYRGRHESVRGIKGTGLGLYIVDRLVKRLGGTLHIGDRAPHGAIFAASFPLA